MLGLHALGLPHVLLKYFGFLIVNPLGGRAANAETLSHRLENAFTYRHAALVVVFGYEIEQMLGNRLFPARGCLLFPLFNGPPKNFIPTLNLVTVGLEDRIVQQVLRPLRHRSAERKVVADAAKQRPGLSALHCRAVLALDPGVVPFGQHTNAST